MVATFHQFDIRNFANKLTTAEGKYHYCPNCNEPKLSIAADSGKYNCFACNDTKAIARILSESQREEQPRDGEQKQHKTHQERLTEWIEGSGVNETITTNSISSVSNLKEIAQFLEWKGYYHTPGHFIYGMDLATNTKRIQQFKPDTPLIFPDGESAKYLTAKSHYDAILLDKPGLDWQKVAVDTFEPITIGEGGKKAGALLSLEYTAIGLCGVEMYHVKGDKKKLVPNLESFNWEGREVINCYDSDSLTNKNVLRSLKQSAAEYTRRGAIVKVASWNPEMGKGIDDVLSRFGAEAVHKIMSEALPYKEFAKRLDEQFKRLDEQFEFGKSTDGKQGDAGDDKKKQPLPPANEAALELAELYRDKLAWESEYQLWRHYGAKHDGVWEIETVESVRGLIHSYLRCLPDFPPFSSGYVSSVLTMLQSDLEVKDWNEQPDLIPLKDGVLDKETLQILPHSPGYRFTWRLPFNWADSAVGCQPIEEFLLKITDNPAIAEVLLCYLSAIVTRRADLQRYLELIGGGGTGKSTFMALAKALAGQDNTVSSQLKLLESNQFETAKFYKKLLVLFPDSERWQGEVSVLKQLTGGDPIRYERKNVQQCKDFVYEGMVILSANEPPESSDRTSGQERRKLTIGLDNRIPEYEGRNLIKEFEPYLPGLLRRCLEISPGRVTQLIKHTERYVPALREKKWAQMIETNPIAAWADEHLIVHTEAKAYIGIDDPEKTARWLYANFCKYQKESGHRGVLPLKRFSANLRDLLKNQVKIPISQGRDRNGAYIEGIGLRCYYDADGHRYPRPITGKTEEILANCDGFDGKSDGLVTAETLGSVGCDGCDGFLDIKDTKEDTKEEKKSVTIEIQSETPIDREENPSHPSHPSPPGIPAVADASPYPSHTDKVTVPSQAEPSLPFEDDSSYSSYPHLISKDPRAQRNEAEKIRQLLLAANTKDELSVIRQEWGTRFEWVWYRMSGKEKAKITQISNQQQLSLLDMKPQPKVEEELQSQSRVPSQESSEDEWLNPEELEIMAFALDSCDSKETLDLLRECWPPHAMNKACKLLTPEKHEQIKRWVTER